MSEHEGVWHDRADPMEKRDWDVPPSVHGEPGAANLEPAGASGGSQPAEARGRRRAPAEQSEKGDWDLP
jgi:hypothetical protein